MKVIALGVCLAGLACAADPALTIYNQNFAVVRETIPLDLKAGDRILFGKWSGTEIKLDGEDLLIMKESDVMGIVESEAAKTRAAPARKKA